MLAACSGCLERGVSEQRADRGQPRVAGADLVAALVLEVIEERADQRRLKIVDVEIARRGAGLLGDEGEQQPDRVAVCGDRVRARALLPDQPVGEERLQCRCEQAHRALPSLRSRRSAASASSSGAACKYQYVDPGLTWPR